jgi:hypothetical protein
MIPPLLWISVCITLLLSSQLSGVPAAPVQYHTAHAAAIHNDVVPGVNHYHISLTYGSPTGSVPCGRTWVLNDSSCNDPWLALLQIINTTTPPNNATIWIDSEFYHRQWVASPLVTHNDVNITINGILDYMDFPPSFNFDMSNNPSLFGGWQFDGPFHLVFNNLYFMNNHNGYGAVIMKPNSNGDAGGSLHASNCIFVNNDLRIDDPNGSYGSALNLEGIISLIIDGESYIHKNHITNHGTFSSDVVSVIVARMAPGGHVSIRDSYICNHRMYMSGSVVTIVNAAVIDIFNLTMTKNHIVYNVTSERAIDRAVVTGAMLITNMTLNDMTHTNHVYLNTSLIKNNSITVVLTALVETPPWVSYASGAGISIVDHNITSIDIINTSFLSNVINADWWTFNGNPHSVHD